MPLFYYSSRSLDVYNFDYYVFADISVKQKLMSIAKERMKNCDTLIVLSTEGNGGTYLLCSTLKLMEEDDSQHIIITGDQYAQLAQMPLDAFMHICAPYQYILFDNIKRACSKKNQYLWLEKAFMLLKDMGKKTLATYTEIEEVDLKVPDFIQETSHEVVNSLNKPSLYPEIVRRIFQRKNYTNVTEELINQISSTKGVNMRMLDGMCIHHLAVEHLAGRR